MSTKANNRFVPSFETLEARESPSLFSLSSVYLHLAGPPEAARAPAQQMVRPTEYTTTDYRTGRLYLDVLASEWEFGYFRNYLQHLTPAQLQNIVNSVVQPESLGNKVVDFAAGHLGQTVWSPNFPHNSQGAQCTDLVDAALQAAGAKTFNQFSQPSDPNGDYVWGNLALQRTVNTAGKVTQAFGQFSDIQAGDIIQFKNVKLTSPNGSWSTDDHHTAIVEKNLGNGSLQILEQNTGAKDAHGNNIVVRSTINLATMSVDPAAGASSASVWVYHPVPR